MTELLRPTHASTWTMTIRGHSLEYKTLQRKVEMLEVRQELTIKVLKAEQYDPKFPPAPLAEFQEWVDEVVAQVPEEFRDTATVEFGSASSYYDSSYSSVEVQYRRPETDEEWEARKADVLGQVERARIQWEHQERQTLAELKAKYEEDDQ